MVAGNVSSQLLLTLTLTVAALQHEIGGVQHEMTEAGILLVSRRFQVFGKADDVEECWVDKRMAGADAAGDDVKYVNGERSQFASRRSGPLDGDRRGPVCVDRTPSAIGPC